MAKPATFTNEQLVRAWKEVADKNGTRKDVVALLGLDAKKGYNNVTQRVKYLTKLGIPMPELTTSRKGVRTSSADVDALKAILAQSTTE